jgi:hypothetical protein
VTYTHLGRHVILSFASTLDRQHHPRHNSSDIMAGGADLTVPATRRPRKSTGQSPARKRMEKENITIDVASTSAGTASRKKSRSKSMGPGGVDVLKAGHGNRRVVCDSVALLRLLVKTQANRDQSHWRLPRDHHRGRY